MRPGLKFDNIFKLLFYPYTHTHTHTLQQSRLVLIFINGVQVKGADRKCKPLKIQLFIKSVRSPTPPTHSLDRLGRGEQESRDWLPLNNSKQEKQHFSLFVDLFSMCSCAVGWVWTGGSTLHLAYNCSDVWFTRLTAVVLWSQKIVLLEEHFHKWARFFSLYGEDCSTVFCLEAGEQILTECLHLKRGVKQNHNTAINSHEDKGSEDSSTVTLPVWLLHQRPWSEAGPARRKHTTLWNPGFQGPCGSFCKDTLQLDCIWIPLSASTALRKTQHGSKSVQDFVRSPNK